MPTTELILPQLGEAITEGTIIKWFKGPGDRIEIDEVIYEVSTEKVDSEVPSPLAGVLTEIKVPEGETVDVGTVLAMVEITADSPAPANSPASAPTQSQQAGANGTASTSSTSQSPPAPAATPAVTPAATAANAETDGHLLSPLVRRLIRENGLSVDQLTGTGVGGRISRDDVLNAIDELHRNGGARPPKPDPAALVQAAEVLRPGTETSNRSTAWPNGDTRFEPFSKIRKLTADRMLQSTATAAYVLTVMEIDYENVDQERQKRREHWKKDEGFSLTYLPFIVLAVADALSEWPNVNASVVEQDSEPGLLIHRLLNIGVAVDLDHTGLIVPVLRQTDTLNLRGAARAMNDLAKRARGRKLRPDDISGGTFTISNNGSFGTYTTAAIINQPQVAVLSTDGVTRKPVVVNDRFGNESIAIHSVGHLALGWDHRAFDGGYAAGFLGRVKQLLETHDWAAEF